MKTYRIHIALRGFVGVKSGRVYHCTPESLIEAPQGDFKTLTRSQYSVHKPPVRTDTTEEDHAESI